MERRKINRRERSCIADGIRRPWGDPNRQDDVETRDKQYAQCLSDCRVCG